MSTEKNWYAVYTKPRWEKKVVGLLNRRQIENFCPLNRVQRQWADRKKIVEEPLFTSYVFVRATEAEHLAIKQTEGVLTFVYWLGAPAIIKNDEIEAIREFITEHTNVKLEKAEVNVNDNVRITSSLFGQHEGRVVEVRNKSVKIFLPTLGYSLIAELVNKEVEVITATHHNYHSASFYNAKAV